MWLDHLLRRYGIVMLILALPGLALPAVAIAQEGIGELSVLQLVVIGFGYLASLAGYAALIFLTARAFRRRAAGKRTSAGSTQQVDRGHRGSSRTGMISVVVGGSLFVVSVLASFLIPVLTGDPFAGALSVFVPGLLGIGGLVVAVVGVVQLAVASGARSNT